MNFSKGASNVIAQYYQLIRLGKHGYRSIMLNLVRIADHLAEQLEKLGFVIMSERSGRGLPLVAFRLRNDQDGTLFDEFAIAHVLRERGWIVPAYTMAPHSNKLKMMRIVVREGFTMNRCSALVDDIKAALRSLEKMDESMMEKYTQYVPVRVLGTELIAFARYIRIHGTNSAKAAVTAAAYEDEHSLQGKTGKTHGVC